MAALWFLWKVSGVLPPFIAAWLIAAFMEPTIKKLRAGGYSRSRAVVLVFACFFLFIGFLGLLITRPLLSQLRDIESRVPEYASRVQTFIVNLVPSDTELKKHEATLSAFGLEPNKQAIFDKQIKPHLSEVQARIVQLGQNFVGRISAIASWLLMLVLTPILTFVLMMDYDTLRRRTVRLIPMSIRGQSIDLFEDIGDVFTNYIRGLFLSVLIYSILASGLFYFLGLPGALLLGFMAGMLSVAPYVGFTISAVVVAVVAFAAPVGGFSPLIMVGGDNAHILGSVVSFVVFDQAYGFLVLPRIAGHAVGLSLFASFFAIAAGSALFGLPGLVLAYPVAGSVKVVLERILGVVVDDRPRRKVQLPRIPLRFRATTPIA